MAKQGPGTCQDDGWGMGEGGGGDIISTFIGEEVGGGGCKLEIEDRDDDFGF